MRAAVWGRLIAATLAVACVSHDGIAAAFATVAAVAAAFEREVNPRLLLPAAEQPVYAQRLRVALADGGVADLAPQFYLMVDRSPAVQAGFIYWLGGEGDWQFIGASPVATGRPGAFDHFLTPLGVFAHTTANMDFRAEGTRNAVGIRGYGHKGMRVFDFGWVPGERAWGKGGTSTMRLQVHATDPDHLEQWLGERRSKGCIRISAALNVFLDRFGLLDADYERAVREGRELWVLRKDRTPTPWSGQYLVVVDSMRSARPQWSPPPAPVRSVKKPALAQESTHDLASVC